MLASNIVRLLHLLHLSIGCILLRLQKLLCQHLGLIALILIVETLEAVSPWVEPGESIMALVYVVETMVEIAIL